MPVEHRADEGGMIAVCRAIERGSARHARLTRPRQISHGALRGHSWADNDDMAGSLFESGARTEALQLVIVAVAGADATGVIALDQSCLVDRKSTRLNSSHVAISYAVFCLKKKKQKADERLYKDILENYHCE